MSVVYSRSCIVISAAIVWLLCHHTVSLAGGYDTAERNWDALFLPGRINVENEVRYINPQRKIRNIRNTVLPGTASSNSEAEAFSVQRLGVSGHLSDELRCLASFRQPFEGHANYGSTWIGSASAIEQHFSSKDYGLTCAYSAPLKKGKISLVGGLSYQEIKYELTSNGGLGGVRRTLVNDESWGWRAGLAYEIPEYALRASLIYNSAIDYDMTGNVTLSNVPGATAVFGNITMPQSAELKVQSGIAPGWLAFGSIKWTDWSVADSMPLCSIGTPTCNQAAAVSGLVLEWQDSWTLTAGAAHQFSDTFSMAGSITWDQGASRGFTSQTDTWVLGLNGIITANKNVSLNFGGTLGVLTSGTLSTATLPGGIANPVGYTASFGDDLLYSLSASITIRN